LLQALQAGVVNGFAKVQTGQDHSLGFTAGVATAADEGPEVFLTSA
jgi:hypothetical protein